MSSFTFDDETIQRIINELPKLGRLGMIVSHLHPDLISSKYLPESSIPIAAVCLQDTCWTLDQIRFGLSECLQSRVWFREKLNPPDEQSAILYMRFYIDAIVSQLYAAGEHLANAIIFMLELTEDELEKYRSSKTSQQNVLGHYLAKEQANIPITNAVLVLAKSDEWLKTMNYRGAWVHNQPPTVGGLWPIYERRKRWESSADGKTFNLGITIGDDAEFSIDDILKFVQPAVIQFVNLFENILNLYVDMLSKKGIIVTQEGIEVKLISNGKWGM